MGGGDAVEQKAKKRSIGFQFKLTEFKIRRFIHDWGKSIFRMLGLF
jgi:hypothetical protein